MRLSERPTVLLALLLAAAGGAAAALFGSLALLGACQVGGVPARIAAALTACVVFFHRYPTVPLGAFALAALTIASAAGFARELGRALGQQRLLRRLPLLEPAHIGLPPAPDAPSLRIAVLPTARPTAFCFGLLRPRVVVSDGLLARLAPDALEAALWHEAEHARRHEPLRTLAAILAAHTFFWLPALGDLLDRYRLSRELAADRLALGRTSRAALAAALCELTTDSLVPGSAGLGDLAGARVERLLDPQAPLPPLFQGRRLAFTAATVVALALLLATPATVDIGALEAVHTFAAMLAHSLLALRHSH